MNLPKQTQCHCLINLCTSCKADTSLAY